MELNSTGLSKLDELCVNTIRFLSVDGVQKANSGHPGMPMGMAAPVYSLWMRHMRHNPANPTWAGRDRFVMSGGHGSMLLYSMLYMTGYDMSLDDLKNFRQWQSKTPGHPEYEPNLGIEVTTGPLGQGVANAVGLAIGQKYLAKYFNRDKFELFGSNIYVIAGDGCLQEGVSCEASSLAGHLELDNVIMIYDDNHITIDGSTDLSFSEDVAKRYEAYGWYVQKVTGNGHNIEDLDKAVENAKNEKSRPSIICMQSCIGFGSPNKQNTSSAHGSPLGPDEVAATKENLGWPAKDFYVPDEALKNTRGCTEKGAKLQSEFDELFGQYKKAYPELAAQYEKAQAGDLGIDIDAMMPKFEADSAVATRVASGKFIAAVMPNLPFIIGGSADLTPSNNTWFDEAGNFSKDDRLGRYMRYGVREHAMAAIMNGISITEFLRAYGATFLVFCDYMRPAMRMAALSQYPSIFVLTHDSVGLGEDGPTHQPVEMLPALRVMPGLTVIRPADANETVAAWKFMLQNPDRPFAIMLSRQGLKVLDQNKFAKADNMAKGAYVLNGDVTEPKVLIMASGSEVEIALDAADILATEGVKARVISMPSFELFEEQTAEYKESVMPKAVKARVAIEAAIGQGWDKYTGDNGIFIGLEGYGASAPGKVCFEKFGLTAKAIVKAAKKSIG